MGLGGEGSHLRLLGSLVSVVEVADESLLEDSLCVILCIYLFISSVQITRV